MRTLELTGGYNKLDKMYEFGSNSIDSHFWFYFGFYLGKSKVSKLIHVGKDDSIQIYQYDLANFEPKNFKYLDSEALAKRIVKYIEAVVCN